MNKERILELADHIDTLSHVGSSRKLKTENPAFTMDYFSYDCGSPACICGWALYFWDSKPVAERDRAFMVTGAETLDIDIDEAIELFNPSLHLDRVTPAQAAQVLRGFAETGDINWPVELYEGPHETSKGAQL